MKLGNIDLLRTNEGWVASVLISAEADKSGFTFTVGPYDTLIELFREVGDVAEGLIGFAPPKRKRKISSTALVRSEVGFDDSKMFLTVGDDDLT